MCVYAYMCMHNILGGIVRGGKCPTQNGRGNCLGGIVLQVDIFLFQVFLDIVHPGIPLLLFPSTCPCKASQTTSQRFFLSFFIISQSLTPVSPSGCLLMTSAPNYI